MFKKAKRPTRIYEDVAEQIEEAILNGELEVGQRLPSERTLAEVFGISRRTLREALRIVEYKGLIEIHNTGVVIKMDTIDRVTQSLSLAIRTHQVSWKNIAQVRSMIDSNIAILVMENENPKDIAILEEILERARSVDPIDEAAWRAYLEIDGEFHLTLARMTGNPVYELLLHSFLDNMQSYYESYRPKAREFCRDNSANLESTIKAIKDGDREAVRQAANAHLELGHIYGAV